MTTQDILFIVVTFTVLFAIFFIASNKEEFENRLTIIFLDAWYREIKIECRIRKSFRELKSKFRLTKSEEKYLSDNSFDNELGIGA